MHIALLSGGLGWHVQDLQRACTELGHESSVLDFRKLSASAGRKERLLAGFDAVIVRTMPPGSLEQVIFRMDLLHTLEAQGVPILNPVRALEICIDKFWCCMRLEKAGLQVPATVVCQDAETALQAFVELGQDVVVKPIFGSEGRGMIRISDPELAWRTFRTLERTQIALYVQQFIHHPGYDLRAFVLNSKILAAMKRSSQSDWRTNVAQGAIAKPIQLTSEQEQIALQAAQAVGTIAAGVDLLPSQDGTCYVIEVNAVPGWKALAPVCGVDVAHELVESLGDSICKAK